MKTGIIIAAAALYCLIGLLMLFAILLQEAKGGGLSALGGTRAESAFGASNPLRKLTVWLSIIFFVLASALYMVLPRPKVVKEEPAATTTAPPPSDQDSPDGQKAPAVEETDFPPEKEPPASEDDAGGTDAPDAGQDPDE